MKSKSPGANNIPSHARYTSEKIWIRNKQKRLVKTLKRQPNNGQIKELLKRET
jgi:hypothetical protein